jgi:glycolate oxidase iron-sulfur subunit
VQTNLAAFIRDTPEGQEADRILRACVHCGFCNATCPTYQLLGDELDGPRGRIYQIKQVLEGAAVTRETQTHLDRCLSCRSCETTCPSGVQYARLADIGRAVVDQRVPRSTFQKIHRGLLRRVLGTAWLFAPLLALGRLFRPLLPAKLRQAVPPARPATKPWPVVRHARRVLIAQGCVQPALAPDIDSAAARVLDALSISAQPVAVGCCGALSYHLDAQDEGLGAARRAIDALVAGLDAGAEAIVISASGCASFVAEYAQRLHGDKAYAAKARRVSEALHDLSAILNAENAALDAKLATTPARPEKLAFQSPCTFQHGLQQRGVVEALLTKAGYQCTPVADAHLCCGSAGTYSILQPEMSLQLRANKLAALTAGQPSRIATANIGCMTHLAAGGETPVEHWIEVMAERLKV